MSICLIFLLTVSLFGCGNEEPIEESPSEGVLRVATSPDFAPFEFVDTSKEGQEQFVGFDIMLAKYLAEELNKELEIVPLSFEGCQLAVEDGKVDMAICGFTPNEERQKRFLLSKEFIPDLGEQVQTVLVRGDSGVNFEKPSDFSGKKLGVQTESYQYSLCLKQLPKDVIVVLYSNLEFAILDLKNGEIDGVAAAVHNANTILAQNPEIFYSDFTFESEYEDVHEVVLMKKGNQELADKVNELISIAEKNGSIRSWYSTASELSGFDCMENISYDDNGNPLK